MSGKIWDSVEARKCDCGSENITLINYEEEYSVRCRECHLGGPFEENERDAVLAWNECVEALCDVNEPDEQSRRTLADRRKNRKRAIRRKAGILSRIFGQSEPCLRTDGQLGRLDKAKIHCSCPMCRSKPYDELSKRDKGKQEAAQEQMSEPHDDR